MQNESNQVVVVEQLEAVVEDTSVQEQSPQAVVDDSADQQTKDGIGKFANADELYKAYVALQSEFTRKCQELAKHLSGALGKKLDVPTLLGASAHISPAAERPRTLRESDKLAYLLFEQAKKGGIYDNS